MDRFWDVVSSAMMTFADFLEWSMNVVAAIGWFILFLWLLQFLGH